MGSPATICSILSIADVNAAKDFADGLRNMANKGYERKIDAFVEGRNEFLNVKGFGHVKSRKISFEPIAIMLKAPSEVIPVFKIQGEVEAKEFDISLSGRDPERDKQIHEELEMEVFETYDNPILWIPQEKSITTISCVDMFTGEEQTPGRNIYINGIEAGIKVEEKIFDLIDAL